MVEAWLNEGIKATEIFAVIGPSICSKCYVVDAKVIDLVQNLLVDNDEKPYNLISEGQYRLDLKQLNALILQKSGIPKSRSTFHHTVQAAIMNCFFTSPR